MTGDSQVVYEYNGRKGERERETSVWTDRETTILLVLMN